MDIPNGHFEGRHFPDDGAATARRLLNRHKPVRGWTVSGIHACAFFHNAGAGRLYSLMPDVFLCVRLVADVCEKNRAFSVVSQNYFKFAFAILIFNDIKSE